MRKVFNILLASLIVLNLSYRSGAAKVSFSSVPQQEDGVRIQVVKDLKTFAEQNPQLHLRPFHRKVKYTLGSREAGDGLVAQFADAYNFHAGVKSGSNQVSYPEAGTGKVITFVDIRLQDDTEGNAYVVAGGIGQRFISILLEATNRQRLAYRVYVYARE